LHATPPGEILLEFPIKMMLSIISRRQGARHHGLSTLLAIADEVIE
jgi:hypothetical protein